MLDEIGHIPENVFPTLFAGLRGFFHKGKGLLEDRDLYRKVMIICAGSLDTQKLTEGKNSPFNNICERFTLNDFSQEQVFTLARNLQGFSSEMIKVIVNDIYHWTAGHPYLTQRLFQLIDKNHECRNASRTQIEKIINRLVEDEFIYNDDKNLQHIFHCLNKLEQGTGSYFSAVKKILNAQPGQLIRTVEHEDDLKLIGIIKQLPDRRLVIRNRIYEQKLGLFFGMEDFHPQTKQVYISYSWQEDSNEMANRLIKAFKAKGIEIIRDKTHINYKDSIKNFMQQIGQGKCVVVVISDKYLKSEKCMFELVEIAKYGDFYDKIFPIVLPDAKIYKAKEWPHYIKHWEVQIEELETAMRSVSLANQQGITDDLELYTEIRKRIASFIDILKNMNTLNPDLLHESGFKEIIKAVEAKLAREDQNK